jgi:hypothetical protein
MPRKRGTSQSELIKLAIEGLDAQIQALQEKRAELTKMTGGGSRPAGRSASVKASASKPAKARRKVSLATRRKLRDAAKKRWARIKGEKGS